LPRRSDFALRLAEDLKAAGAAVWIDQLDIEPGEEWDSAVEDGVTRCPRMLLILSPSSVKSKNVRDEISFALRKQKTIIPVLYLDCDTPLRLERLHQVDFRTDYARGLQALLKTLGAEQPSPPITPAPSPSNDGATRRVNQAPGGKSGDEDEGEPPPLVNWLMWIWANIRRRPLWAVIAAGAIIAPVIPPAYTWIRDLLLTPDRAFNLAQEYWSPENRKPDYKESMRLFRIAADAGNARAMANVGWIYETGLGRSGPDHIAAIQWYDKAVRNGDKIANGNIGRLYEIGCGVHRDIANARFWYKKAADAGLYEGGQRELKRLDDGNILPQKC